MRNSVHIYLDREKHDMAKKAFNFDKMWGRLVCIFSRSMIKDVQYYILAQDLDAVSR